MFKSDGIKEIWAFSTSDGEIESEQSNWFLPFIVILICYTKLSKDIIPLR